MFSWQDYLQMLDELYCFQFHNPPHIFLAHLVYQPRSLYNHALSIVIVVVGIVICAHLPLAQG